MAVWLVAQVARPASGAITLDEALALAERAPDVIVVRAAQRVAEAEVEVARSPYAPTFSAATHSITARASLALALPLRWGGQRGAAVAAAQAGFAATERSKAAAVAAARRELRVRWLTLAAAEATARIAAERSARATRIAEAVQSMFDAGRTARIEQARAAAEAALARSAQESAEQARATAAAVLRYLLGRAPAEQLATAGDPPPPTTEAALDDCVARARASSPEVRLEEVRLRTAESRLELARRQRRPAVSFEVGVDLDDPTQPGTDKYVGLGLTFPRDADARMLVADAEREAQSLELERRKRSAAAEAEDAWRRARAGRLRLETLDAMALPAAREAAELARLAYREGKLDLFRLLDSERALSDAESARWEAYLDWAIADADLTQLVEEGP